MKKTIYNIFSLISMAAVLFASVACEEKNPIEGNDASNFPELVEDHDVEPGTVLTLTIQPNAVWSISIPKESYEWFKIEDGKFKVQTLSGVSLNQPKTISIWTTSDESFDIRSCDITMKVGGESKVIAKYTLRAAEKVIAVYPASLTEDGSFVYVDGKYQYAAQPLSQDDVIELKWDENQRIYSFPINVNANFQWSVDWPEWARADINVESKVGDTCFEIYGISSALPMEDAVGQVTFKSGETVLNTFKVKIPGSLDVFEYNIGGYTSLSFDYAGYFHADEGTVTKVPVQGLMFGPSASRVELLEKTTDGYATSANPWVNISLTDWDGVQGADVLQWRNIQISVSKNLQQQSRNAILLFLPATAPANVEELLADGGVKEEYAQYAVPLEQTGRPDEYFTFETAADQREAYGLLFARSESTILPAKGFEYVEGCSQWQYDLSYVKETASSKSTFYITYPYETVAVYDKDGNEVVVYDKTGSMISNNESLVHWLSYNSLNEGIYGQIVMDMTQFKTDRPDEIDGYIVFKDETSKVFASVHCYYVSEEKTEEDVLEDVSETMFANPDAAKANGVTIYKVVSGPTYENWKSSTLNIYKLAYTKSGVQVDINTSDQVYLYQIVGSYSGPEMVTVDDDDYTESCGYLLEWDPNLNARVGTYDGVTTVKAEYGESYTETIQLFSSSWEMLYVVICELKLN